MAYRWLALLVTLHLGTPAWGHGMNHPGPNGGEIRMPGIFHTEVYMEGKIIRAYLLDGEMQNAVIEKSTVSGYVKRGAEKFDLICKVEKDYFGCRAGAGREVLPGDRVVLQANRQGQAGIAIYQFPFKYPGKSAGKRELASER